jgi:integrase
MIAKKGKRTRENMKTLAGLLYKFGIPRNYVPENLNLATFLKVGGGETNAKSAFTEGEIAKIKNGIGKVPYADYVYCLIYLGFRPSEFLALDAKNYDRKEKAFIGGAKTEAGTNRVVTVSPKIQSIVDRLTKDKISGPVFCENGKKIPIKDFREYFYKVLEAVGIDNPTTEIAGNNVHRLTPHSCRHTFATLIKKITAPDKDKLELIGHSSEEMLRYYQDVSYSDLRKITDAI